MKQSNRIAQAKSELWESAYKLSILTRFNVIAFNSAVQTWQTVPLVATWRNRAMLRRYLPSVNAAGMTNTFEALQRGLDLYGAETVFLLTDGMPTVGITNTNTIIENITWTNHLKAKPLSIHTIAFFLPEGAAFLKLLAERNSGSSRVIK